MWTATGEVMRFQRTLCSIGVISLDLETAFLKLRFEVVLLFLVYKFIIHVFFSPSGL